MHYKNKLFKKFILQKIRRNFIILNFEIEKLNKIKKFQILIIKN